MEKLDPRKDGRTPDVVSENIEKLRELFPEAFTEGSDEDGPRWKVDFDALREIIGEYGEKEAERYSFTWHGKPRARLIAQTPSTGTLRPCREESVNWDTTKNLFIEGDNLEVLKLLQKSYHKKVKMIYIDPPYNTGNDFIYPDKFADNLDTYLRYTGQIDDEGFKVSTNTETGGRYHTNWLNMMYPRLKLARNLLKDDGVLFVSIDDAELPNLLKLCGEIFGEENHIATIVWQKRYVSNVTAKWLSDMHDFIVVFARSAENLEIRDWERSAEQLEAYRNPDGDPRGRWRAQDLSASKPYKAGLFSITGPTGREFTPPPNRYWRCNQDQFQKWNQDGRIWWGRDGDARPMLKTFLSESERGIKPHTWWDYNFAGHNKEATLALKELFGGDSPFDTPKPVRLMTQLLKLVCNSSDLVLDFFAGSCPLAEAVLRYNLAEDARLRFVMVQLPEASDRDDYPTISAIGTERIRRVIEDLSDDQTATRSGVRLLKLDSSSIKPWDADFDNVELALLDSVDNIKSDRSDDDVLYELLLKYGLDLAVPIETRTVTDKKVYVIGGGALIVCLADGVDAKLAEGIVSIRDEIQPEVIRVVFKDSGFKDDVAKTNVVQVLKQVGIEDVKSL
ncbi:MAG: site-specific DNA-methyltransferase [Spirochaeta sp.]|jgi:adenine-specific DNA-methyltransferase|nr:site-specific DNA-methyltransferase [Spirochaeta sp.]